MDNLHQCIRCDKYLENSMFVSKTGKSTKTCSTCRQKNLQSYYTSSPSSDNNPIDPKEMKKRLFEKVLEIGENNEFVESESGIEFSCRILITSFIKWHTTRDWKKNC